ncbi:hypothetical protein QCE47_18730 [Caballeronia sp. LZ025]|nr:hypothetical protein [Caballeronia sp. LZ025]MDR5734344.1 hypothetical protein [Caballeronia sp. LZ025]
MFIDLSSSVRKLTGTCRDQRRIGQQIALGQKAAQRAAAQRHHERIDRAADARAERLDLVERQGHRAVRTLVGNRLVEDGLRREPEIQRAIAIGQPARGDHMAGGADRLQSRRQQRADFGVQLRRVRGRGAQQFQHAEL